MARKSDCPAELDILPSNPHYKGATAEMVGRALLKHREPEPQAKVKDQTETDARFQSSI